MKKTDEMLRMERDLNGNPELLEKLDAEIRRIAEAGEAKCDGEALLKAAAALGYITAGIITTKSSARKAKTVIIG